MITFFFKVHIKIANTFINIKKTQIYHTEIEEKNRNISFYILSDSTSPLLSLISKYEYLYFSFSSNLLSIY